MSISATNLFDLASLASYVYAASMSSLPRDAGRWKNLNIVVLFLLLSTMPLLGSCDSSRTANVKPGDVDYPIENPYPKRVVQFTAVIPTTLKVTLRVGYSASASEGGSPGNGTACVHEVGYAVTSPYSVAFPLKLTGTEGSYRGTFSVDRFQWGRCGWHFVGVWYAVENQGPREDELVTYADRFGTVSDNQLDVWCVKAPKLDPKFPEVCSRLSMLKGFISPDFENSIPENARGNSTPAVIGNNTQSITIQFHDIDSAASNHLIKSDETPK
jgi:hypothetical protein